MRKSSLKQSSLKKAVNSHRQNEAVSGEYFQVVLGAPGAHNKLDKFLDIVALKKGICAKALGIYCHCLV